MEAAARAAGIRSGVYWRHENGKQGITLEFVRLYARAFAVDPGLARIRETTRADLRAIGQRCACPLGVESVSWHILLIISINILC